MYKIFYIYFTQPLEHVRNYYFNCVRLLSLGGHYRQPLDLKHQFI